MQGPVFVAMFTASGKYPGDFGSYDLCVDQPTAQYCHTIVQSRGLCVVVTVPSPFRAVPVVLVRLHCVSTVPALGSPPHPLLLLCAALGVRFVGPAV